METEAEEETYDKVIYIIIGILVIVVTILIFDIMTGGTLFKDAVCALTWYLPGTGPTAAGRLGCGGIAL